MNKKMVLDVFLTKDPENKEEIYQYF